MLNPTDFASADDYVAAVMAEDDHAAHGDDMAKSVEHAALLDLVPRSEATHVAVSDGAWSDPATWHEGRIPDAGAKVLIPEAISVTYDSTSQASLFTVRVDGKVEFATDQDTQMEVDTFVVSTTGKLNIGTEANPVQQGVSAQIVIADNGPIDVAWDPMLLSRGVISHGEVQIHGQDKSSHLKVSTDAMQGDTQLVLEEAPEGWQVGDQLVLTGTHYVAKQFDPDIGLVWQGTEDEEVVITAIDGNVITLDRPLTYDHDTPRDDLSAYVANYSRNVVIATENADDVPVHQRGHTMFMHSDKIDVRYAEFRELGRTDKSKPTVDADQAVDVQSDTNVTARYAFHLHRTGVDGDHDPSIVTGNAVWGSPGWGFTQHSSSAIMENNASYNTFGVGFMAETGDETGAWRHNIAIKAEGLHGDSKEGGGLSGDGFWFSGRLLENEGNVAAGVNNGFVFHHRSNPDVQVSAENVDQPEALGYLSEVGVNIPAIQHFLDNEVLASRQGLFVVKAGPKQDHDVRSILEGFTAWEVRSGVNVEYTAHYTWIDLDLVATRSNDPQGRPQDGIVFGNNAYDMVINGARIDGFKDGVSLSHSSTFGMAPDEFGYVLIDIDGVNLTGEAIDGLDPSLGDLVLTRADLVEGRLQLDLPWGDAIPLWTWDLDGRVVRFDGVKTDSVGSVNYSVGRDQMGIDQHQMSGLLETEGYYTTPDGRKIVIVEEYFADRATGELQKIGIPVQLAEEVWLDRGYHAWLPNTGQAIYRGEIDLNSAAPVTANDMATTQVSTPVVIDVLGNDSDPEGDALILDGLVQPRHGKVEANSDGTVTYTPDRNFVGEESFNYWTTDDNGSYTRATVQVSVVDDVRTGPLPNVEYVLYGSAEDDTLFGSPDDDKLYGRGGDDVLRDGGGNDVLVGGLGKDRVIGGAGDDVLRGGDGNDVLSGGLGKDRLVGGAGDDVLRGGDGNDVLVGGLGKDRLVGGAGDDVLRGGDGNDVLSGGLGKDRLVGGAGEDVLSGGIGGDVLIGGLGSDYFEFTTALESLPGAERDRIHDFSSIEGDRIDLFAIDSNESTRINDSFIFVDTAEFSNNAGELRYFVNNAGHAILRGDTNGDGNAELEILVANTTALTLHHFLL